jgi:ferric-dicitrate binding protein FerR (iron transport regulator)
MSNRLSAAATLKLLALAIVFLGAPATLCAEPLREARVTQVIRDVKLLPGAAEPRPATVNDDVRDNTAVRTGQDSRSELTFPDQTLARLGANTIFSFQEGTRSMELGGGAMLLRVPKGAGGAQIRTAAVTAAITGTTVLMEHHKGGQTKFIVLEGTARITLKGSSESKEVEAGEMMTVDAGDTTLSEPFRSRYLAADGDLGADQ